MPRDDVPSWAERCDNVDFEVVGQTKKNPGTLVIRIDLSKDFGLSKSGKTTIIGTTHGAIPLGQWDMPEVVMSLNVYEKKPHKK